MSFFTLEISLGVEGFFFFFVWLLWQQNSKILPLQTTLLKLVRAYQE
jgi:hypothetical protein